MMKFAALVMLLSVSAFADSTVSTVFKYSDLKVKVDYVVKRLPLPALDDSALEVRPETECISWTYVGTSPDDPGVCGQYRETGKYILTATMKEYPVYSLTEVMTDLKSGLTRSRRIADLTIKLVLQDGYKLIPSKNIPSDLDLNFTAYTTSATLFGCAVNDTFTASPVLDVPVNLGLCSRVFGQSIVKKEKGVYSLIVLNTLKIDADLYGFWMVRDFPRADYVRKDVWENALSTQLMLKIK